MESVAEHTAFPHLSDAEMDVVRAVATRRVCRDGDVVFCAGQPDIDFCVVESGALEIQNPTAGNEVIATHGPGQFAGDIDLLTRRPVIVNAVARGPETVLLCVPGIKFRHLLGTVPRLGEKLMTAFTVRRDMLAGSGVLGMKVIGPGWSGETTLLREFLHKNFVPSTFYDSDKSDGQAALAALGRTAADAPVVQCANGHVTARPDLRELARCVGVHPACPTEVFDLAIVGSGPAGMAAAVYAASESLSTVVLDRLGPGGQAGGSSMIENFIGFPSGLSGTDLATRGVLQMMKFGALLLTPVRVRELVREAHWLRLRTDDDAEDVRARVVIAATGARWRKLDARGADRFERAGIYYAATSVEARVCTGREVAVVGAGNSAGQAAMFLSECSERVHMIIRGSDLGKVMSDYLVERIRANDRIVMHTRTEVEEVVGDQRIESLRVVCRDSGKRMELPCSAMFVFIGAEPNEDWLPPDLGRDGHGYVLTGAGAKSSGKWELDRDPCELETTIPRLLAAGDLRAGSTKRVGFAVGDGSMAVTCVHRLRELGA